MDNKNKEYEDTIIFLVEQITQRLDKTLIYSQNINDFIESQRQAGTVYEQNIQQLNDTLAERDQSIQQLEQEVLFYATSKSWKITRPLRKVVNFFKRSISKASS